MSGEVKLQLQSVSKVFKDRKSETVAVSETTLEIRANEFATLVGPSGCGKSTLLNIVAGLEHPTTGQVLLDGRPVVGPGRDRGLVFQTYTLFPWLTVRENVEFALRDEPISKKEKRERTDEELNNVGLTKFSENLPSQLSGGMKQRTAIARALVYRPSVLLMDEPFGALDAQTRADMQQLLTEVWERHKITVLFVTHDVDEAVYISDCVYVMSPHPGRIQRVVSVSLARPRHPDMELTPEFMELKSHILRQIRRPREPGDAR